MCKFVNLYVKTLYYFYKLFTNVVTEIVSCKKVSKTYFTLLFVLSKRYIHNISKIN